jgi:hypothetical protein
MADAIWVSWLDIAERHADAVAAVIARSEDPLTEDVREDAMVCITAAASCVGSFAGSVRRNVDAPFPVFNSEKKIPTETKALEILKVVFDLGAKPHSWLPRLRWLFELRDPLVHHSEEMSPGLTVPSGDLVLSAAARDYSAANSEQAVALVNEIISYCFEHPRPVVKRWVWRREDWARDRYGDDSHD